MTGSPVLFRLCDRPLPPVVPSSWNLLSSVVEWGSLLDLEPAQWLGDFKLYPCPKPLFPHLYSGLPGAQDRQGADGSS